MDWRPLVGVTPQDAGTLIEQILAREVARRVIDARKASG